MRILLFAALSLSACSSGKLGQANDTGFTDVNSDGDSDGDADVGADGDADGDADGTDDPPCEVNIDEVYPEHGASDVYYRDIVVVWLEGDDPTADIQVEDEDGNTLAGVVTNEDGVVTFTPDDGLVPDSDHEVRFTWCDGEEQISFTTSELGAPLEVDLTDETFALDLGSATWVSPAGIGGLLDSYLTMDLLVGVESAGDDIDFIGALSQDGTDDQNTCTPTIDFDPVDFSTSPYFEIGPNDMPLEIMDFAITIFGMKVTGTFAPDGGWLGGTTMYGAFDIAEVGPALGGTFGMDLDDPDLACTLVESFGISCEECPHKDEVHCLTLHLTDIDAQSTGDVLVPVDEAYCHETCPERDDHPECDVVDDSGDDG